MKSLVKALSLPSCVFVSLAACARCTVVTNDGVVAVTAYEGTESLDVVCDAETELNGFVLYGSPYLTVEGTVAAAATANTPFFNWFGMDEAMPREFNVGRTGLVFRYDGADTVDIGLIPRFPTIPVTNVLEEVNCPNGDFEYSVNAKAWTFDQGGCPDGNSWRSDSEGHYGMNSDSAICSDGYGTPHGSRYAVLRRMNSMSIGFNLASDGLWRVVFLGGCRPGYQSNALSVTVTVDAGTADEKSHVFPAETELHGFQEYLTGAFELAAGGHTLTIGVDDNAVAGSMRFFDWINFQRVDVAGVRGELTKTGSGTLAVSPAGTADGTINVDGGVLELHGAELTDGTVNVASGATLRFCPTSGNIVQNGGFEEGLSGWSFVMGQSQSSGSGVVENGNAVFAASGPYTTSGTLFAYVRTDTGIRQQVDVPKTGRYLLTFLRGNRNYGNSNKIKVEVRLGDALIHTSPADTPYVNEFTEESATVELEGGSGQWLSFTACEWTGDGAMFFLDDVQLRSLDVSYPEVGTRWNFDTGSVLELYNSEKLFLGSVTVDGTPVSGGRRALENAGVTVSGDGRVHVGDPSGMTVIWR